MYGEVQERRALKFTIFWVPAPRYLINIFYNLLYVQIVEYNLDKDKYNTYNT